MTTNLDRARELLFEGKLHVVVTSPKGMKVSFRLSPKLNEQGEPWDGRAWWLFRGSEYVGIMVRRDQSFEVKITARSTKDEIIWLAVNVLLLGLGHRDIGPYTIEADES